jgi:predicted dehydrogenase
MDQVNVGVIGTGGISGGHFTAYQKQPDVKMLAVADIIPERAQAAAESGARRSGSPITENSSRCRSWTP